MARLCLTLVSLATFVSQAEARTYRTVIVHKHVHSYAVAPALSYAVPVQAVPQAVAVPAPVAAPAPTETPPATTFVAPPVTYYSAPVVTTYSAPVVRYSVAAPVQVVRPLRNGERRRLNRNGYVVVSP